MQTSLEEFTKNELDRLLEIEKESGKKITVSIANNMTAQEYINENIMKLMKPIFEMVDRSPATMQYLLQVVYLLSQFKPISPLTLSDDEFIEISRDGNKVHYQNIRDPKVFKEADIGIYHIDGKKALDLACGVVDYDKSRYEQLQLDLDV